LETMPCVEMKPKRPHESAELLLVLLLSPTSTAIWLLRLCCSSYTCVNR